MYNNNEQMQLFDALNEISQREKDLMAAIGISKILLENNETNSAKIIDLEIENNWLQSKIADLDQEIKKNKEEIMAIEERFDDTNMILQQTEEDLIKARDENKAFKSENNKNIRTTSIESISIERFNSEINIITLKFRKEYDIALSIFYLEAKINAEKKCSVLENQIASANQIISQLEFQVSSLKNVSQHDIEINKGNENNIRMFINYKSEQEEIEDKFLEIPKFSQETESTQLNISASSFSLNPKSLGIYNQGSISIIQNNAAQAIELTNEKFFKMVLDKQTVDVVKANSPTMNEMNISTKSLYELAIKNEVPLHKWHIWIESQMIAHSYKNTSRKNITTKFR